MANRLDLHDEFITILGTQDEKESRVYFQPPASITLKYPCIKYSLSGIRSDKANDRNYRNTNRYEVVVIDPDPDSTIHEEILEHFAMCSLDAAYTADNLNHKKLSLYY